MSMQEEVIFREAIVEALRKNIADLDVKVEPHKSLWYSLHVSDSGQIEPTGDKPKRGHDAFEQDIVVFEIKGKRDVPRVVIETKVYRCSTHVAITYSNKARLLKQVYPFLRYILALGGMDRVTPKLIKHGEFFDGIMVLEFDSSKKSIGEKDLGDFIDFIRREINASRKIGRAREGLLSIKAFLRPVTIIEEL